MSDLDAFLSGQPEVAPEQAEPQQFYGVTEDEIREVLGEDADALAVLFGPVLGRIPGFSIPIPGGPRIGVPDIVVEGRAARYSQSDLQSLQASLGPVDRMELQDRLVEAGLLQESEVINPGQWNREMTDAVTAAFGIANASGSTIEDTLLDLATRREEIKGRAAEAAVREAVGSFVKADPAAVKQTVNNSIRKLIGRDPTADEISEVSAEFRRIEAESYNRRSSQAMAEVENTLSDSPQQLTHEDYDPNARLDEYLAQRFSGTVEARKQVAEMHPQQHNPTRLISSMARMIGSA